MRKVISIFIISAFCSCNTAGKLFKEYTLYHRDKSVNYPKENLTIRVISDTTGLFINTDEGREVFNQNFSFSRVKNDYLLIGNVDQTSLSLISLKQGDTIVLAKKRLLFFYNVIRNIYCPLKELCNNKAPHGEQRNIRGSIRQGNKFHSYYRARLLTATSQTF